MNSTLETEVLQLHAEICAGLADPNRILILYELSQSSRNVTELSTNLKMPQPLVSRHLKVLRERGMVLAERHGTVVEYTLADSRLIQALDLLETGSWEVRRTLHKLAANRLRPRLSVPTCFGLYPIFRFFAWFFRGARNKSPSRAGCSSRPRSPHPHSADIDPFHPVQ